MIRSTRRGRHPSYIRAACHAMAAAWHIVVGFPLGLTLAPLLRVRRPRLCHAVRHIGIESGERTKNTLCVDARLCSFVGR